MSWILGSAEVLSGSGLMLLAWAITWIAGNGGPTRNRLITLPLVVLVMSISGLATIMHAFGKL